MKKLMLISGVGILIYLSAQVCGCGCCKANTTNSEITTIVKNGNKTIKLKITGTTCADCSNHVTQALEALKGVAKVELAYPIDIATIKYDASKTNPTEMIKAIEKAGYKAEIINETKSKK
ncbi:MAG TPA: cation transporter [Bacteroidia bacterium]|nr:cation transporter [Bacteroidia bacterium]